MNRSSLRIYRKALEDMLVGLDPTYFITLNDNRDTKNKWRHRNKKLWGPMPDQNQVLERATRDLKRYLAYIDRDFLGTYWAKRTSERCSFMFFPEHLHSNVHWHGVGDLPLEATFMIRENLEARLTAKYRDIAPSGTVHIQRLVTVADQRRVAHYITKELQHDLRYWHTSEFWSRGQAKSSVRELAKLSLGGWVNVR